jgi:hypothetical protein
MWGSQSWLQPPFRRLAATALVRRLKAGCRQDCLPHHLAVMTTPIKPIILRILDRLQRATSQRPARSLTREAPSAPGSAVDQTPIPRATVKLQSLAIDNRPHETPYTIAVATHNYQNRCPPHLRVPSPFLTQLGKLVSARRPVQLDAHDQLSSPCQPRNSRLPIRRRIVAQMPRIEPDHRTLRVLAAPGLQRHLIARDSSQPPSLQRTQYALPGNLLPPTACLLIGHEKVLMVEPSQMEA